MVPEVNLLTAKPIEASLNKRGDAPPRRKTRIDKKARSWVEQNIKIRTKSDDDGNFKEAPTDCYGEIEFIGAGRKSKAKFIRFSHTTSPVVIFNLMTKHWLLGKPRLVMSVVGSTENFDTCPKLKPIFQDGLLKVAQTPGAWIISHGIHEGVTQYLGNAIHGAARACIGISTFGAVSNRHHLLSTEPQEDLGGKFPYRISCNLLREGSFLDHNHTHHLLVDDGTERPSSGMQFRSEFEKYLMESAVGKVPVVLLVLQGCADTIEKVWARIRDDSPISIVVVKDSGKAADLIAFSLDITEGTENDEIDGTKILAMTEKLFPELQEDEQKAVCDKVVFSVQKREFFTVYDIEGNLDIDEAILMALLNGQKISPMDQLQFTLLWDRADLAKEKILCQSFNWQLNELQFAMIMSLAMDRVDFVKLLLERGVGIELLLTNDVMEFLYGYQSYSFTSTLKSEIDANEYVPPSVEHYPHIVDILCSIEGINPWKCAIPRKTIQSVFRLLTKNFISKKRQDIIEKLRLKFRFEYPYRELFFWAVMNNKQKMAVYLWQFEEEAISKALMAAEINNVLYKHAQKRDLQDDIVKSFSNNAKQFQDLALGLLDECFKANESKTLQLITSEFHQFADQTCLGLAVDTEDLDFVSHNAVQLLLNELWTGAIKTREVTDIKMICAFFMPPLINSISFYSESAVKEMSFVNTEVIQDEDDENMEIFCAAQCDNSKLLHKRTNTSIKQSTASKQPGMPYYKKVYQFYFKTPLIKFYANVFWYLVFLLLFVYVAMNKVGEELMILEYFLFIYVFSLTVAEIYQVMMGEGRNFKIEWLHSQWDNLDAICIIFFYVTFALRLHGHLLVIADLMYAINSGMWVLRLLQVFFVNRLLGPYVVMIFRMMQDLLIFLVILCVFLISYGVTSKAILDPEPKNGKLIKMVSDALFKPYYAIYGEIFWADPPNNYTTRFETPLISSYHEPIAWFLLGVYMLVTNVLVMNILIAAFNNTFLEVQRNAAQIWKFQRHDLVLQYVQSVQLPPPFSLIIHAVLLGRWVLHKCRIINWKDDGNSNLRACLSSEAKEELLEFENKCMTVFIRKREAKPIKKSTSEILNYVSGINTAVHSMDIRLKEIEINLQKSTIKDDEDTI